MAKLTITSDGNEDRVEIKEDRFVIGRAPTCSYVIQDTASSRKHCEIERTAKGWRIIDLDSSNGTKVNGTAIERAPLRTGDEIQIGKTKLKFDAASDEPETSDDESAGENEIQVGDSSPFVPEPEEEELELVGADVASSGYLLRVTAGELKDKEIQLKVGPNRIGRAKKNDIALPDTGVSGLHAEVSIEDGRGVVRDLGSTNGTLVNGARLDQSHSLSHGDRIQIGVVKLVFVDAARQHLDPEDHEDSLEEDDDLEFSTLSPARSGSEKGSLVFFLVFVGLLGGAGYVAFRVLPSLSSEAAPVAIVPQGSLITTGWSFEEDEALDLWQIDGRSAQSRVRSGEGEAVSGLSSVRLSPLGEGDLVSMVCLREEDISISTLNAYRVSGHISTTSSEGFGLIKLEWWSEIGSNRAFLGEVFGNPVGGSNGGFREASFVAIPPTGATHARVGCVAIGEGATCLFDDVSVFQESRDEVEIVRKGELGHELSLTDRGLFRLAKGSNTYFSSGEVLVHFEGEGGDGSPIRTRQSLHFRCDATTGHGPNANGGDGTVEFSGAVVGRGMEVPFVERISGGGSTFLFECRIAESGVKEVGYEIAVDTEYYSSGLKVVTDSGVDEIETDDSSLETDLGGVRSLIFGSESERIRISLAAPARLSIRPSEGWVTVLVLVEAPDLPKKNGRIVFETSLQTAFTKERDRAIGMCANAESLEENGRLGAALSRYEEVLKELPFNEQALARAQVGRDRIRTRAIEAIRNLETALADANVLRQRDLFAKLSSAASLAAETFGETAYGKRASEISGEAADGLAQVLAPAIHREAERMYSTGQDLLQAGHPRLARVVLESLLDQYQGSEAAERAKSDPQVQNLLQTSVGGD